MVIVAIFPLAELLKQDVASREKIDHKEKCMVISQLPLELLPYGSLQYHSGIPFRRDIER